MHAHFVPAELILRWKLCRHISYNPSSSGTTFTVELTKLRLPVERLLLERFISVPHARKEVQVINHHAFTREQQQYYIACIYFGGPEWTRNTPFVKTFRPWRTPKLGFPAFSWSGLKPDVYQSIIISTGSVLFVMGGCTNCLNRVILNVT